MNIIDFLNQTGISQVFTWTIIHTLWIGMLLWLIFNLGKGLINNSAFLKYNWALAMQFLLLMAFVAAFVFESNYHFSNEKSNSLSTTISTQNGIKLKSDNASQIDLSALTGTSFNSYINKLAPLISIFWTFGALLMVLRFSANLFYIQNLRNTGIINVEKEWLEKFQMLVQKIKLKRKIAFFKSEMIDSPMTIGHFKPIILIPIGMLSQLSSQQVEAILIHELAHIKRSDYLVNVLQNIIETLLFFHPVTWILSAHIRIERENLCDDHSVDVQKNPIHLAKALFEIQKKANHVPGLALGSNGSKYLLKNRIERLFNNSKPNSKKGNGIISAAILVLFLIGTSLFHFNVSIADSDEIISQNLKNSKIDESANAIDKEELNPKIKSGHFDVAQKKTELPVYDKNKARTQKIKANKLSTNLKTPSSNRISVGNDEITVIKTTSNGQKLELVFTEPDDIKKLKIDGKKIKPKNYVEYKNLLNKEVFNSMRSSEHDNTISYSYHFDDDSESKQHEDVKNITVQKIPNSQNKIVIKIDDSEGDTEIIEIPGPDFEMAEVYEIIEDVMPEIDIDFEDFELPELNVENIRVEKLEKSLNEAAKALEKSKQRLEEKTKDLESEFNEKEMAEVEKELQKALNEIRIELQRIREKEIELNRNEKSQKIRVNSLEDARVKLAGKMERLISHLKKDEIIAGDAKSFEVEFLKGEMIVNGQKQSKAVANKYIEMLDIDRSANIRYNKNLN